MAREAKRHRPIRGKNLAEQRSFLESLKAYIPHIGASWYKTKSFLKKCVIVSPRWKMVWLVLTKLSILLPYDPAITFFGIYPNEMKTYPHKNLHMDVYTNFIHNCLNLKATRMLSVGK